MNNILDNMSKIICTNYSTFDGVKFETNTFTHLGCVREMIKYNEKNKLSYSVGEMNEDGYAESVRIDVQTIKIDSSNNRKADDYHEVINYILTEYYNDYLNNKIYGGEVVTIRDCTNDFYAKVLKTFNDMNHQNILASSQMNMVIPTYFWEKYKDTSKFKSIVCSSMFTPILNNSNNHQDKIFIINKNISLINNSAYILTTDKGLSSRAMKLNKIFDKDTKLNYNLTKINGGEGSVVVIKIED